MTFPRKYPIRHSPDGTQTDAAILERDLTIHRPLSIPASGSRGRRRGAPPTQMPRLSTSITQGHGMPIAAPMTPVVSDASATIYDKPQRQTMSLGGRMAVSTNNPAFNKALTHSLMLSLARSDPRQFCALDPDQLPLRLRKHQTATKLAFARFMAGRFRAVLLSYKQEPLK